jgi:sigma-B regulation protein RsbU (phosphoserine phosphatase)
MALLVRSVKGDPVYTRPTILIVDDEPFNVDYLEQELEDLDYDLVTAANGREALERVDVDAPDVILLDIMMPEMDGFQVLAHLKVDRTLRNIPVIVVSALDDMASMVKGIQLGAEDYLPKPFEPVLLRARIGASVERKQLRDREMRYLEQVRRDLDLAWRVQAGFLPADLPDISGWQLAATLTPSRQTSGDFYDMIRPPDGRLGILVADVADKGMGAALQMVLSRTLIRTYAAQDYAGPRQVLEATNRRLLADTEINQFVTAFYGILDPLTGELTYSNAGHNPPYLLRPQDGNAVQALHRTGMALGVLEDETWGQTTVHIAEGDMLVLYTDGITEAQNGQEAFFGADRLLEVLQGELGRSAQDVQEAVLMAVQGFVGDAPQFDDITLVIAVRT